MKEKQTNKQQGMMAKYMLSQVPTTINNWKSTLSGPHTAPCITYLHGDIHPLPYVVMVYVLIGIPSLDRGF